MEFERLSKKRGRLKMKIESRIKEKARSAGALTPGLHSRCK